MIISLLDMIICHPSFVALVLRHDVKGRLSLLRLGRQIGAAAVAELGQAHVARVAGVLQPGAKAVTVGFKGKSTLGPVETMVFLPLNSR